ncbi:hypothetical protein ACLB1Q_12190 [Escherichia coli]
MLDVSEITTTAPGFYAILPFTPIIGVLIFDGNGSAITHHHYLVICMLIASILEVPRALIPRKFSWSGSGLSRDGRCICKRGDAAGCRWVFVRRAPSA